MSARTCGDVRADLSAYLDGDLDAGPTAETRRHLESCAGCRAELELTRLTVGALRRLPDLPPPAAILAGVRARLRPEPWYRRLLPGRQWQLGVPIGALATVLVVVGVALFQSRHPGIEKSASRDTLLQEAAPGQRAASQPIAPPPSKDRSVDAGRPAASPPAIADRLELRAKESREAAADKGRAAAESVDAKSGAPRAAETFTAGPEPVRAPERQAAGPRIVCLLPPGGITLEDVTELLRREGAVGIAVDALEPRAIREAFAPHRGRPGFPQAPTRGWVVTASLPSTARFRLLDALANRAGLRILEQPPATRETPATTTADLHITVLQ